MQSTAHKVVSLLRSRLLDDRFQQCHRRRPQDFTRRSPFSFVRVAVLILQKTRKAIQPHLNEFFSQFDDADGLDGPTPGAWSQARAKLCHTAFVELSRECVVEPCYQLPPQAQRWYGRRLLATDGSLLRLPSRAEVGEQFGWVETQNQHGLCGVRYPQGRVSVLYDVLNRLGLDANLAAYTIGEITLAEGHLVHTGPDDVILYDRGYAGFEWFMTVVQQGRDFIVRCPRQSFAAVQAMFAEGKGGVSRIVRLHAPPDVAARMRARGWPCELEVRLVSVTLPNGELEVLATSLLDEAAIPTEAFGEAYHGRWGVEGYYGKLKGRLELEAWSGTSVEAVRQDFHATVLLSNLESVLVREAQAELSAGDGQRRYPQVVNHAVALHALKSEVFELLVGAEPIERVVERLGRLFLGTPVSVRSGRRPPRKPPSLARSLQYQRNVKRVVY
jgi:hypothetical protein